MKHVILAAAVLASPAFAEDIIEPAGHWTGLGHQSGETWGMSVQFVPGGARVDYPDLSCGGVWVFDQDSYVIRGTEWLTYGHEACLDEVALTVSGSADGLRVLWFNSDGSELAYADLTAEAPRTGKKNPDGN